MPDVPPGWLHAGTVGRPHGLDGSFHVMASNPSLLVLDAVVRISTSGEDRLITRRAGTDARPILRIEGCEDRSAAQTLSGADLLIDRTAAPELEEDEWWAEDLEGCAVVDGGPLGRRRPAAVGAALVRGARGRAPRGATTSCSCRSSATPCARLTLERREIDVDLAFLGEE